MAIEISPKFGLKTYTAGADPHPTRVEFNEMIQAIEELGAVSAKGVASARPTAGLEGRFYWATDQSRIYYDDGVAWQELTSNGGGGAGAAINVGGVGSEGTSSRSARADHVHPLPLASGSVNGAMSTLDKNKLDGADSAATALRLVIRDANGRAKFADPISAADAATKLYVDQQIGFRASMAGHTHDYSEILNAPETADAVEWTGVLNKPATFPPTIGTTSTTAKAGNYVPSWTEISGKPATFTGDFLTLVNKPATFAPTIGTTSTTAKAGNYVPSWGEITSKPATFAPTIGLTSTTAKAGNWTPTWGDVTGKPTVFPPAFHSHGWNDIEAKPSTFPPSSHQHHVSDVVGQPGYVNQQAFNDFMHAENNRQQGDINYVNSRVDSTWNFAAGKLANGDHEVWHDGAGINSIRTYNANAASGAYRAVWVNNSGRLGYNLSSEKFKQDFREYARPLSLLKEITPQWFKYIADVQTLGKEAPERVNFIAEHLFDAGLTEFVSFDGGGEDRINVQTINEQLMVTTLWSFCQQQQELIENLEQRLIQLEQK